MQARNQGLLTLSVCGGAICMAPTLTWLLTEKPIPTLISGVLAAVVFMCVSKTFADSDRDRRLPGP